jgi:hypothetical protein
MLATQPQGAATGRAVQTARADEHALDNAEMIEAARAAGHTSLWQIAAYLNEQGATTPRGST